MLQKSNDGRQDKTRRIASAIGISTSRATKETWQSGLKTKPLYRHCRKPGTCALNAFKKAPNHNC